jgi:hypothetical protein
VRRCVQSVCGCAADVPLNAGVVAVPVLLCPLQAYKPLCTSSERNMSVMWGKLAADTLTGNYEQVGQPAHTLRHLCLI